MIEREYKVLLNCVEYVNIKDTFLWDDELIQINFYYIDNIDELKKHNVSVRIRVIEDQMLLQIKLLIKEKEALHIAKEIEKRVSIIPYIIRGEELEELTGIKFPEARLMGLLITERKLKRMGDIQIALDKNNYLGMIDYELEIEYKENNPLELIKQLKKQGLSFEKKSQSKYGKFIALYNKSYSNSSTDICTL